jgi:glycosidase
MPTSIWSQELQAARAAARGEAAEAGARDLSFVPPVASPQDWRDCWIYQIVLDRFNNPQSAPARSWDGEDAVFQGGTFNGVRAQLDYLQDLGVGAIWLSPVLKNCQYLDGTYHGYGIQDFLAVEPRYASDPARARQDPLLAEAELRALVDEIHARGMYVIFDIVLNHAGDVFDYAGFGPVAPWRDTPYEVHWRDAHGQGRPEWTAPPPAAPPDAVVWPQEMQRNEFFRRRGLGDEAGGDFASLKEFVTDFAEVTAERGRYTPVRDALIHAYQYAIAKYDVDGFRIDTLKYIEPEFAQIFGNAMREFALSIGKRNFFTFGEVYDDEERIARFIGRNAMDPGDLTGVDAALDFPLFYALPQVAKGQAPPTAVMQVFTHRKQVQRGLLSSHGEAGKYFVTFLDNHDQHNRFYYADSQDPQRYADQVTLGVACLLALQGIPCLYYGTEQGLHGAGGSLEAVREALWGKPGAFDRNHPFYRAIRQAAAVRQRQPALRYGRQYFRPLSGDGQHFGPSTFAGGVLAFSRILQDQEVLVIANTNAQAGWQGQVVVDFALNPADTGYQVLYSNKGTVAPAARVINKPAGSVVIEEIEGGVTPGPIRALPIQLQPLEVQILGKIGGTL